MLTKKQIKSLAPKAFAPVGKMRWVLKKEKQDEIDASLSSSSEIDVTKDDFEQKFISKKVFAPELGKYVDKVKRGYYTTSELKIKFSNEI